MNNRPGVASRRRRISLRTTGIGSRPRAAGRIRPTQSVRAPSRSRHSCWPRCKRPEPTYATAASATPDRTDGSDLLALCQENLVFRCDAFEGIGAGLLAKFRYFGVPDNVDYQNIPWRSSNFDEVALTQALATRVRAQNAFEQYRLHSGSRALGFCCSVQHADFMANYFVTNGIKAVAVHSGTNSAPRSTSLEALANGEIDIVFSVDMFNEGVDVPSIDTVLMLRPTESAIVWMQQFGRGLRKTESKEHLTVVDYIGNHRVFQGAGSSSA